MVLPPQPLNWVGANLTFYLAQEMVRLRLVHFHPLKWPPCHPLYPLYVRIPLAPQGMMPSRLNFPGSSCRPVDISVREKAITERVDKDRDRLSMSRTNSRSGSERPATRPRTPPAAIPPTTSSPRAPSRTLAPNVRPTLSFANVAASKESTSGIGAEGQNSGTGEKIGGNI